MAPHRRVKHYSQQRETDREREQIFTRLLHENVGKSVCQRHRISPMCCKIAVNVPLEDSPDHTAKVAVSKSRDCVCVWGGGGGCARARASEREREREAYVYLRL